MTTGAKKLTNKFWCPKYVFEFISEVNFMGQPKVDDLDPRFGNIPIQKHYVFRLKKKKKKEIVLQRYSNQKVGKDPMSTNRGLDKQNVVDNIMEYLFSLRKEVKSETCYNMEEP